MTLAPGQTPERVLEAFDQEITKIEVNPQESPEEAVRAFYTYLKARRMQDGFNLLLSLDLDLQAKAEEVTSSYLRRYGMHRASVIIMEVGCTF